MCVSVNDCVVLVGLSQQGTESSGVCVRMCDEGVDSQMRLTLMSRLSQEISKPCLNKSFQILLLNYCAGCQYMYSKILFFSSSNKYLV